MSKFKIGDKVQVLVDIYGYSGIPKGTILSVVADGTLGEYWINTTEVQVSLLNAYSYEFELVEGPEGNVAQAAQTSNETPSLVHKTTPKNDDSSEGMGQPRVDNNAWFELNELPPVGTKCIFTGVDADVEGVILAHVEYKGEYQAIIQCDGDWWTGDVGEFRPIKTKEQLEEEAKAQEREKAVSAVEEQILEQMGKLNVRNLAEHIVDTFDLRFTKGGSKWQI